MHISIFDQYGALNSPPVFSAFRQGLNQLGIAYSSNNMSADVAVIWSMLWAGRMRPNQAVWQHYRSQSKSVIVLEVGMLDRGRTWKLGVNGVNNQGWFGNDIQPGRAVMLGLKLKPWTNTGTHIIIAPQRSDSEQWANKPSVQDWLQDTVKNIRQHSNRPIMIRPHPRQRIDLIPGVTIQHPIKLVGQSDAYDFDIKLSQAWAVVNDSSGPGSQAIIAGVPAFVGVDSLSAPVANLDLAQIENPLRPDRTAWLDRLAHTEWTIEEIATGRPFARLLAGL